MCHGHFATLGKRGPTIDHSAAKVKVNPHAKNQGQRSNGLSVLSKHIISLLCRQKNVVSLLHG